MHIGINAQLLSFGQNYRNGGVSRYIRYLLKALSERPGEHTYTIFVNGLEVVEQLGVHHEQMRFLSAPWPEARPAARVSWEQLSLPTLIRRHQIEVLHSPVNVLPRWLPGACASVVTLHDLAFLRFPEVLTRAKRMYHQTFTVHSLRQASLVIAVSESTKQDAHELVGIPNERIKTVYTCIDDRFSNVFENNSVQAFRQQHGFSDGYIFFLGTLEPRKNVTTLLEAYAHLRQTYQRREKLVLAGGKGWLYEEIFARVRQLGLESEVIFPGFVADTEQALWYRASSAFVYPSLYEGFGIPVAEALACGVPTVTSTVSSLPEAGAGVALCVEPQDVPGLSEAMQRALTDEHYRNRCEQQAPAIAKKFSAQGMAEQTIAAYEQAVVLQAQRRRSHHPTFVH
ncbi:MAG TPA: glycosyltransferase family 1 protein [Ktedonobacteraceae bacterium]|jgi:glycosyltransferase involved in cell wall biosynthesis|nr:glycosyltransferase family 1 protein [Ktedonobacteraceae bacterium]